MAQLIGQVNFLEAAMVRPTTATHANALFWVTQQRLLGPQLRALYGSRGWRSINFDVRLSFLR